MTVGKAIKLLQQEDPNAELVLLPAHLRHKTIRELEYRDTYFWLVTEVVGKDSTGRRVLPAVVLIMETSERE